MTDENKTVVAPKKKIGGWLLVPAIFLYFNLFLVLKMLLEVSNRPSNTRIIYPALFGDIVIGIGCLVLIRLLHRRSPLFPQLYIIFVLLIFAIWSLVIFVFNVGAHAQWMVVLLQCLLVAPYLVKSRRVQETFPAPEDSEPFGARLMESWRQRPLVVIAPVTVGLLALILVLSLLLQALR